MFGLWLEGNYRSKPHFLPLIWTVLLAAAPLTAVGYFLGDTKAILNGCEDQWTLQSAVVIPRLFQMTVCVDVHVVVPGAWAAFLYTSVRGPNPDLGLEGDTTAIYGWLLQVRHRFPLKLTPMQWHRVCLRRDAKGNTFSLEVDGRMVAERTVIAQAIPPSGTLWLGCHPRLQPPGAELGKVELYLFRMWADLNSHGFCEDGTVIGWDSQYWSVTSSKAKEKDPYLLCEKKRVRREASIALTSGATTGPGISREFSTDSKFTPSTPNPSSTVKLTTPPITTAGNQLATGTHVYPTRSGTAGTMMSVEESPVLKCDTRQLCSNDSAYFWMSVTARAGDITASDFQNLVSKTFTCGNTTNSQPKNFTDFCQNGGNIKVVEASCSAPNVTISTTCGILLLLNGTLSACDLQLFAKMMPNLTVQVERVGQNLCEGLSPSEGRFVRCTSTSSLEDICRSNAHSNITCSVLEPDFQPVSEPGSSSCRESAPHFCDCTAFCNSTSQFYAMKLDISNQSFTVEALKNMFLQFPKWASCSPTSLCKNLTKYETVRLECHGTSERLYSCMVIVEMSGQVDECTLKETVQNIIKNYSKIKIDKPLTRMMVCGSTGSSLQRLLESNFTWATSYLQPSDVCQTEPTLPLCEIGETLAVLMTDICPSQLFTTQPPTQSTTTPAPILHINTTNTQLTTLSARLTTRQSSTSQPVSLTNTNSVTTTQKNVANKTPLPPTQTLTTDGDLTTHTTVTQTTTEHYKQLQTVSGADADINTTDANNNSIGVKTSSYTATEAFLSQIYTTRSTIPSLNNNYTIEKHETTTSKDNTQPTSVTQTINNSHIFKTTETSSESTEEHTAAAAINKHTTTGNAKTQANYYSVHTTARPSNNHTTSQDNNTRSNTTSYKSMPSTDNTTPRHTNTTAYSTRASSDDTTSKSTRHSNNDTNLHSTTTSNNDNTTSNSTSTQDNKNATLYTTTSSRDEDTTLTNTTSYDIMPTNDNKTPSNINTTLHSTTAHTTNNKTFSTQTQHNNTVSGATTHSNNDTTLRSTALGSTKTPINNHTKSYTTTPRNNDTNNVITALNKSNSPHHVATTTSISNNTAVVHPTITNNYTNRQTTSGATETATATLVSLASYTDSKQSTSTEVPFSRTGTYKKTESYTTSGPFTSRGYTTQSDASNTNTSHATVQFLTSTSRNSTTLDETTTTTHNTTTNVSPETTDTFIKLHNATPRSNSSSTPTSPPPPFQSTAESNDTVINKTSTLDVLTAHTTADPETTAPQNHTSVHTFTSHNNKSVQYNNSVTAETSSSTLSPTASSTDSQQLGSNYTQDNNASREISNYTTTGPLTSPNYSTQNNALNTFDSYTTEKNLTTSDIAITNSQISTVTHNTTAFLSNYTTPESPSSINNNRTTNSNATTARNIYTTENSDTTEYDTTPSNNFTTNIPTLSSSYTTVHSTTSSSDNTTSDSKTTVTQNYTTPHNFSNVSNKSLEYNSSVTTETKSTTLTPTSSYTDSQHMGSNYTQDNNESREINNNTTTGPLTSPNYSTQNNALNTFDSDTTENNLSISDIAITNSQISAVTHNTTAFLSNYTTPESPSSINNNLTTNSNATTARNIYTTGYNTTENSDTTEYDTTPSKNFTTNIPTLSSSYTTVHSTTSSSDNTTSDSETIVTQNYTTPHNFSNVSNKSVQYNSSGTTDTMSTTLTPLSSYTDSQPTTLISSNYTQDYNESRETSNYTTVHSTTSSSDNTTLNSDSTTTQIYTIPHNSSNISNKSALYNSSVTTETMSTTLTPTSSYTDSQHTTLMSSNYTQDCNGSRETSNCTTIKSFTSENYSTQNNVSAPFNGYTTVKDVIERQNNTTQNTTIIYNNFTTPANLTPISKKDDNATTTRNSSTNTNYTTENSNTTLYVTTPSYNLTMRNNATVLGSSSLTQSTTKSSSNYPTMYNTATTSYNHQTTHETTAQSKSNFTVNNATTANSKPEAIYNTTAINSNTIANNATTPGSNSTEVYSLLTTKMHNTTPSTSYKILNNTTVPDSNDTTTDNEVLVHNRTIADSSYTTTAPALTSVCPNKTITCSTTIAPISNPQHVTNTVNMNATVTSAAAQKSETTPTKNTNVDILKSTHTTKSPQVSMKTTDTTTVNTNMYLTISRGSIHKTTGPGGNTLPTTTTTPNPAKVSTTTAKAANAANAVTTTTGLTSTTTSEGETQLNDLSNLTKDPSQLNSSEISNVAKALEEILQGPSISKSFGQKALDVISNLLDADVSALSGSANRLTKMVERLSVSLKVTGGTETLSAKSLVLSVRTVDGTNFVETAADIVSTDNVQHSPSRTKRSTSPLGSVFLPSSLTSGLTPEEQLKASRVQFTFYTKNTLFQDISLNNQTNVSQILGFSVANLSISNLEDNVRFKIRNPGEQQIDLQATNATCVFWDYALNDEKGGWRSDGCFVLNITSTHTTCSCNHLTSFAVLLDLSREGIMDKQQAEILTFITYIGCGISAIFLSVTLLTYLLFPKLLRDIPAKILVQLSLSLLLLNLVFLLDSWLSLYDAVGLCISTAFFLHYFLLTSFTWAGLEALHMYLSIVRVFTPYLNQYMLKFSLMGWGIPLIVVIVVISVDKDNYGPVGYDKYTNATSNDFCWLRNDIAFYVGVVAYFLLIFVLCLLVFIVVMYQLSRIKKQNPHNQSPNRSMMTDMRSIVGLFLLLGLTWGFALFAWGPLYLPFVYLFSIFNSLQGFFLFVFHCAVKENVRRQWRIYLCCGKLRLLENQDSSRTATNKRKTTSMTTGTTSNPMSTSRGSVVSDVTNSSGSAPADSGISSGSNIDVLLNEIHTANLNLQSEA